MGAYWERGGTEGRDYFRKKKNSLQKLLNNPKKGAEEKFSDAL